VSESWFHSLNNPGNESEPLSICHQIGNTCGAFHIEFLVLPIALTKGSVANLDTKICLFFFRKGRNKWPNCFQFKSKPPVVTLNLLVFISLSTCISCESTYGKSNKNTTSKTTPGKASLDIRKKNAISNENQCQHRTNRDHLPDPDSFFCIVCRCKVTGSNPKIPDNTNKLFDIHLMLNNLFMKLR